MYAAPKIGQVVNFTTKNPAYYYYEPKVLSKIRDYRQVPVVEPLWEERGIFFVATGDEKNPIACITLKNVVRLNIDGENGQQSKDQHGKKSFLKVNGSKGNTYIVTMNGNVPVHCTCPGFMFHHGVCKHLKIAEESHNET